MFLRYLAPLALLLGSGLAAAADPIYCVSTTAELKNALDLSTNDGIDNQVRIRGGVYSVPADRAFLVAGNDGRNLAVSGGWSGANGTCTTQVQNAGITILRGDPNQVRRVLEVSAGTNTQTAFALTNLTLENGDVAVNDSGGCLYMVSAGQTLRVERVILQGCVAPLGDGGALYARGPRIDLIGNLVMDNEAKRGAVFLSVTPQGIAYVNNNTVTGNAAIGAAQQAGGLHLEVENQGQVYLNNNIVWGNTAGSNRYDIKLDLGIAYSANNHFGASSAQFASNVNPTAGPPGFASGTLPLLAAVSVCRDYGNAGPPGGVPAVDLLGAPRVQGFSIDRGAFEAAPVDALFADGFES